MTLEREHDARPSGPKIRGANLRGASTRGANISEAAPSPGGTTRGFARPHLGTLRRADAGAASRAAADERDRLCGFDHWRDALEVVDRSIAYLDLPHSAMRLMSRLCSLVPAEAWDGSAPLLAWPSNLRLATELAMDVRSVQRLIAKVEARGLIARRLGRGHRRTNRRLDDGSLAGDGGLDLAPMLATARRLERTFDTPRQTALLAARDAIAGIQQCASGVIEAAEALDQAVVDGIAAAEDVPVSIDAAIDHARRCRDLAGSLRRRLGTLDLDALAAVRGELDRQLARLSATEAAMEEALRLVFARPAVSDDEPASPEGDWKLGKESPEGDWRLGNESPEGDSGVVQNDENPTSTCLDSARQGRVPARGASYTPDLPGLADPPRDRRRWQQEVATLAPAYAPRFRIGQLVEACPPLAEAAELWGVDPDHWDELADDPMVLETLCRHAAASKGFNGERWGAEMRRWGLPRAVLATVAALGKPSHLVSRNTAALLSWYFTDGLARPEIDLLATINANRRHWSRAHADNVSDRNSISKD